MGYFDYYLAFMLLSYALHRPWVMVGVLVFILFRPWIPDPWIILKSLGRIRSLERQIAMNPANVTARRDLAELWIARLRPKRAIELLDEARARDPKDAELLYLTGLARHRAGDSAGALDPLVEAVAIEPKLRWGEPYLVAAEALAALDRLEEAEDALERFIFTNSSSVQGQVLLADVRKKRGDRDGARAALDSALSTWSQIPGYRRRTEIGWWLRAHAARLFN